MARETPDGAVLVDVVSGGCWELNRVGARSGRCSTTQRRCAASCEAPASPLRGRGRGHRARRAGVAGELSKAGLVFDRRPREPPDARCTGGRRRVAAFRDRFAIEPIGDDGVLIDLLDGQLLPPQPRPRRRACLALQESTSPAEAAEPPGGVDGAAARRGGRAAGQRSAAAGRAGRADGTDRPVSLPPARGRLRARGERSRRPDDGRRVESFACACAPDTLTFKMLDYVRAITPKLLHLRGVTVLHASACVLPEGLTAFAGGAGPARRPRHARSRARARG